jgi:hypothetical protein
MQVLHTCRAHIASIWSASLPWRLTHWRAASSSPALCAVDPINADALHDVLSGGSVGPADAFAEAVPSDTQPKRHKLCPHGVE